MVATVDKVFIDEFEGNIISLAQQRMSYLRSCVNEVSSTGKSHAWDRVGAVNMSPKTTRGGTTPVVDTPFSRRLSIPTSYNVGDLVAHFETVQTLIDPASAISRQFGYAVARQYDDVIIEAAVGDSRDGDGNTVAFDTNSLLGDGSQIMNLQHITDVAERFMLQDVDPTEGFVFVISPNQAQQLLNQLEYNSYDFNALRPLMSGQIVPFMGFDFIVSNRLQAGSGADSTLCFAMAKDAVGLQVNNPIKARVSEDASASFDWRIYAEITIGATRVEDEKVVVYDFDNTASGATP